MYEINGLPLHVLLVHAVVVLVPLTAFVLVLCSFWPAARARLVWPLLALAVVSLALIPVTTRAGQWLMRRVEVTPLVAKHIDLGDSLLPWVSGLLVLSALVAALHFWRPQALLPWWHRSATEADDAPARARVDTVTRFVLPVVVLLVAIGAVVQVVRVGESGSKAVWTDRFTASSTYWTR